ncbi:hypothetical protein AAZX31_14G120200 [Glycine max]
MQMFYEKIEHLVEVSVKDCSYTLSFFKDNFMHYVRYQGKFILVSKNTPLLINKWKYNFIYLWQCHFDICIRPNLLVVQNHMLQNSFLIKMVMKRLDTIVPIIPLIRSLAKAKFCNVFGHPICKPIYTSTFLYKNFDS